ncbi:MAG TPA: hypothetical protein PKA13_02680 [Geminicoccaceae bacterium]|nr:hypothetical protein [Geminicoccus sp.]HMU48651.1 hypothetical protein [Geminicoccaceae bacterium]
MKPRTLALLERLERRAVDEHRRELAEIDRRAQAVELALSGLRAARPIEAAIGWGMDQGAAPVAAFWAGSRASEQQLRAHIEELRRRREVVAEAMRGRLAEARRYELLAEAEARRAGEAVARREQAVIDDAVLVRRAAGLAAARAG